MPEPTRSVTLVAGAEHNYGLVLAGGGTSTGEMLEIARRAELGAIATVYCVEAWRSALVPLTAIAASTSTVGLGTYILNAAGRTPLLTAMSAVDLDELSDGRLVLCVGIGNGHINHSFQGIDVERPARYMAEYVTALRAMLRAVPGETVSHAGERVRVDGWSPAVRPRRPGLAVHLAATYPAMRRAAGRVADGVALGSVCSAAYLEQVIRPAVRGAAEEAGRDPDAIAFRLVCHVAVDDDREAARTALRHAIARMFWPLPHPYYEFLLHEQGFGAVSDRVARLVPDGRVEEAADAIPDELLDTLAVSGTPAECRSALRRYDGLADEVLLAYPGQTAVPAPGEPRDPALLLAAYDRLIGCAVR